MTYQVIDMKCPGCGSPVNTSYDECPYCARPVIISTFNSVYNMPLPDINKYAQAYSTMLNENSENQELNTSIAFCYLKLKLYPKAQDAFEKAIEANFDNSELFFYAAVCLLSGKKAFLTTRPIIDNIMEYVNAALMIEPKGIYYYFLAYIKYDYFERKHFITSPTYIELLQMANNKGISKYDIDQLYEILNVSRPECM